MNVDLVEKPKNVLMNKNFLINFIGRMISDVGDELFGVCMGWYILSLTKSGLQMSIYMAVGTIVYMVMGPIGGVIADRFDRKSMIIWMDIIRGIIVTVIGLLMINHIVSIWLFYISASLLSICGAFYVPASNAIIPKIVKRNQLSQANSFISLSGSISALSGIALSGILYAVIGINGVFLLNAASFFICGFMITFIHVEKSDLNKSTSDKKFLITILRELKEGFLYLWNKKAIFIMLCFFSISNLLIVPMIVVFIPYIFNVILKTNVKIYSAAQLCMTIGTMTGVFLIGIIPQGEKIYKTFRNAIISIASLFLCISLVFYLYTKSTITPNALILMMSAGLFLGGGAAGIINIPVNVVIQKSIPDNFLGRVSSFMSILPMIATPIGMVAGGAAADVIPMKYLVFSTAVLYTIMAVALTKAKSLKEL